ncbi:MAG: hypothetical protein H7122_06400 [Chitinophagaceae bacterium]|nr:hypothetical protein [Chitinophagaceae bacterium]
MINRCLLLILFASHAFTNGIAQDLFDTGLKPGRYGVGFRIVKTEDYSRPDFTSTHSYKPDGVPRGRKMTMHIWYPSVIVADKKAMRYGEYIGLLLATEKRDPRNVRSTFFRSVAELSGDTSLFSPVYPLLIKTETKAYMNAAIAPGQFPLIIYPDNVHVQSLMCEYLASKGYIVISPVIGGTYSHSMEYSPQGIETGVADMQFALGYIRSHYKVKQNFSVMGIGFNATLSLAMQMRNHDAKAMVSLEGGITTGFEEGLIQRTPYFDLQRCNGSILIIHSPHPDVKPEITYKYKYAEKIYQHYPQSSEFYFLNYGIWERRLNNIFPKANKGNTWKSFAYAAESVAHYMNWKLNNDSSSKEILLDDNWPPEFVKTSFKKENELPPTREELSKLFLSVGMRGLERMYEERKKSDPQPFTFNSFYQIGQELIQQAAYRDLLTWAKLYADSYPNSALPFSMDGRAQLELKNKIEARKSYEKALSLLPSDLELTEGEKSYFKTAIENRLKGLDG